MQGLTTDFKVTDGNTLFDGVLVRHYLHLLL